MLIHVSLHPIPLKVVVPTQLSSDSAGGHGLLRARRERPRRYRAAAKQDDEIAPSYT